jgi:predicted polyphosphate/ATP-dependent NAD kinase
MKGIRRDRYGFRAYVKVGTQQREKRFKPDTSAQTMKEWRDDTRVALRALKKLPAQPGSL